MHRLHLGQKLFQHEAAFRQVDQVRAVVDELAAERRRRGQEAGMAPHHDADVHAGQRGVIQVGAGERLRHEARGGRKSGRVVVADQVVVDRLRDVDAAQRIAGFVRGLADDAHGVRRVVAADVKKVADLVRLQHLEDFLAIRQVRLVARRSQRGRRGVGHQFQVAAGFLRQVDQVFVDDAAHAVLCAVDSFNGGKAARFQHHAGQRLVDDCGRAAALGNQDFSGAHGISFAMG